MGTNYYHYTQHPCSHCGRPFKPRHIGKSSGGWCFALHVYPNEMIRDLADWEQRWRNGYIENEYGDRVSVDEMLHIIKDRSRPNGNDWSEHELLRNHAEPGPNGLARHKVCESSDRVKHGEGTWDLIIGDESSW